MKTRTFIEPALCFMGCSLPMNLGAPASRRHVSPSTPPQLAGETPALPGQVHGQGETPRSTNLSREFPIDSSNRTKSNRASVLVGLLWCLALLSIVVVGVLHTATLDLRIVKNQGDSIQAHYFALAGIEKAKAILYHDAKERRGSHQNHRAGPYDSPQQFRDIALGRGLFRVFRQGRPDENQSLVYGVSDEESRLNFNTATAEEIRKLEGMTAEIAAAIIDYRDEDNTVTPGGGEVEEYAALRPPYQPRNGPFQTIRELLMVRGMDRERLLGEDANQNGLLDPDENDGSEALPRDNQDGLLDTGWSGLATVHSATRNINAAGERRVNVQEDDENALTGVQGVTSDIARAIVQYRGQNRLESLADLLDVTSPGRGNQPPPQAAGGRGGRGGRGGQSSPQPNTGDASSGQKVISQELLMDIADDLTTQSEQNQSGAVNINTAGTDVLVCLPGISKELAQAIVSYRQSSGFFPNIAWLLKVPGVTQQIFKQVAPRVTARSETFRILSEGRVNSTGARKRIQVVVRLGTSYIDTLSYREDDL